MNVIDPRKHLYSRRAKRYTRLQKKQRVIIVALISISTLISIMLPVYVVSRYF